MSGQNRRRAKDVEPVETLNLSAEQAARVIGGGVTAHFLRQLAREGRVPSIRLGDRWLFARGEIERVAREGIPRPKAAESEGGV